MSDLIDREEAIKKLKALQEKKVGCNCGRNSIYQANALGYAIAIIKSLPPVKTE